MKYNVGGNRKHLKALHTIQVWGHKRDGGFVKEEAHLVFIGTEFAIHHHDC
jgi:hypothetical protein